MPEEQRLKEMVAEQFGLQISKISRDLHWEDLALDSLDLLGLLASIEDEFDIHLEDDLFTNCETLGEMSDLIIEKTRG